MTDCRFVRALRDELMQACKRELVEYTFDLRDEVRRKRKIYATLIHVIQTGLPDSEGGQYACQRVNVYLFHSQCVSHLARVLTAGTTETGERVMCNVIALLDTDFTNCISHVLHSDINTAQRQLLAIELTGRRRIYFFDQAVELLQYNFPVQRLVGSFTKYPGEVVNLDLAEQDIAVRHREWTAAAIRGRAGNRTCGIRSDSEARTIEIDDGSAPRSNSMYAHHRHTKMSTGNRRGFCSFVLALVMTDVGRCSAHVESDDPVISCCNRRLHGTDHPTRRAGENRILATEVGRIRQPSGGLHELQSNIAELCRNLFYVAIQYRREIGIDCRGITPVQYADFPGDLA